MAAPRPPAPPKASAPQSSADPQMDALLRAMQQMIAEMRRTQVSQQGAFSKAIESSGQKTMTTAMTPVLKLLDTVVKLVSLFIMPFTNLLMPLILPILYFLTPIVKFINLMMRPFFTQLMEWVKSTTPVIQNLAQEVIGGGAGLTAGISGFIDVISQGIKNIANILIPLITGFWNAIDWDSLFKTVGTKIDQFMTGTWDFMAPYLEKIWGGLRDFYQSTIHPIIETIREKVVGVLSVLVDAVVPPWNNLVKVGIDTLESILNTAVSTFTGLIETIRSAAAGIVDAVTQTIINLLDSTATFLANMEVFKKEILLILAPLASTIISLAKNVNDAIQSIPFLGDKSKAGKFNEDADPVMASLKNIVSEASKPLTVGPEITSLNEAAQNMAKMGGDTKNAINQSATDITSSVKDMAKTTSDTLEKIRTGFTLDTEGVKTAIDTGSANMLKTFETNLGLVQSAVTSGTETTGANIAELKESNISDTKTQMDHDVQLNTDMKNFMSQQFASLNAAVMKLANTPHIVNVYVSGGGSSGGGSSPSSVNASSGSPGSAAASSKR